MERYCQIAARSGFPGLPPNSMIQASFKAALFLDSIYQAIINETLASELLLADETPHRMLEGDDKKRWLFWAFSNEKASFFECHNTRSGDVSTEVLKSSNCIALMSDVYRGYKKSVKAANQLRAEEGRQLIQTAYCNAHARRQFFSGIAEEENISADSKFMVNEYQKIYRLEKLAIGLTSQEILEKREQMRPIFENMRAEALLKVNTYSRKSSIAKAYSYFLNN